MWNPPAGLRHPVEPVSTPFIPFSPVAGTCTYKPPEPEAHTQIHTHTVDLPVAGLGYAAHPGAHPGSLLFPGSSHLETHTCTHAHTHASRSLSQLPDPMASPAAGRDSLRPSDNQPFLWSWP